MSGQQKKAGQRDLSQFNYGAMSSLVVNQGEPNFTLSGEGCSVVPLIFRSIRYSD